MSVVFIINFEKIKVHYLRQEGVECIIQFELYLQ